MRLTADGVGDNEQQTGVDGNTEAHEQCSVHAVGDTNRRSGGTSTGRRWRRRLNDAGLSKLYTRWSRCKCKWQNNR